jgi:Ethanolamine utilization protein EutJ (predicted chaperonin)
MMKIQVAVKPDKKEIWLGVDYVTAGFLLGILERAKITEPHQQALAKMIQEGIAEGFEDAIEFTPSLRNSDETNGII